MSEITDIGPARVTAPPMKLSEMPQVDAVVLSHNHYDHTVRFTLQILEVLRRN